MTGSRPPTAAPTARPAPWSTPTRSRALRLRLRLSLRLLASVLALLRPGGYGWRSWDPFWGDPFFADRAQIRTIERFEAGAEIVMHKGKKPEGDPRAYDAREIMANLASSIVPAPTKRARAGK
jgi:hypothetical protein